MYAIAEDQTGRAYVDVPRADRGNGNIPAWTLIIHELNGRAAAAGQPDPFGAPELTPMSRVPGEDAATLGTCEWYPDYRVEHRRGADFVRIVARTPDAAARLRDAAASVYTECPACGGDGIIPAIGRGAYVPCATCDREDGLTECCGASLTGTDDGMACRSCYQIVSPII